MQWPEEFVEDFLLLAGEFVAPYNERINVMMTVMRRLVAMSKKYHTPTPMEAHLLEMNKDLVAQLRALRLQQDIRVIREVESTQGCESCFDDNIAASKGVHCSNRAHPHFFCGAAHNGCFGDMVSSQANDLGIFASNSLNIVYVYCTALLPRVISTSALPVIGRQTSSEALTAFIGAITEVERSRGLAAMEQQRLQYMNEIEKQAEAHKVDKATRLKASTERHRLRIIESIITLHCPHCDLAIFDFNGCFAVEHSAEHDRLRQGCGLYFCGWCLAKFGTNDECHSHVKACPHSLHPGSHFGTFPAEFNIVHGDRRRNLVLQYLQQNIPDARKREETKIALRRDLNDLGIAI